MLPRDQYSSHSVHSFDYKLLLYDIKQSKQDLQRIGYKKGNTGNQHVSLLIFVITLSNAVTWPPIFITSCLHLAAFELQSSDIDVIGTILTSTFPVNAMINPWLYTLTTTKFREKVFRHNGSRHV